MSYTRDVTNRIVACTTAGITGAVANAGLNGNRTSYTDKHTVFVEGVPTVTETSTSYCYDQADRLLASTVTGDAIPEANPVADGLAPAELAYDDLSRVPWSPNIGLRPVDWSPDGEEQRVSA